MSVYLFTYIGIKPFEEEYTYNTVTLYLLSALLKSRLVHSKDLAEAIGCSPRQAQRIIYNSFEKRTNTYNLNLLGDILKYLNYSYSNLFKHLDKFIKSEYHSATFIGNSFKGYHKDEFENYPYDIDNLERVLKLINKSNRYGLSEDIRKELLSEVVTYPVFLIKQLQGVV